MLTKRSPQGLGIENLSMTAKEVADLLINASERVDFYWNFLVVILVALVGWLIAQFIYLRRGPEAGSPLFASE